MLLIKFKGKYYPTRTEINKGGSTDIDYIHMVINHNEDNTFIAAYNKQLGDRLDDYGCCNYATFNVMRAVLKEMGAELIILKCKYIKINDYRVGYDKNFPGLLFVGSSVVFLNDHSTTLGDIDISLQEDNWIYQLIVTGQVRRLSRNIKIAGYKLTIIDRALRLGCTRLTPERIEAVRKLISAKKPTNSKVNNFLNIIK